MAKNKTKEELRTEFLNHLHALVDYWALVERDTAKGKLEGLVHSMLVLFDGGSLGFPAIDLVMRPHPEDKQFCMDEDEDWIENGTVINDDAMLHEFWYTPENTTK